MSVTVERSFRGTRAALVSLANPQRGNALSGEMGPELVRVLSDLSRDSDCDAVVLTGQGKYFCTGMDLARVSEVKAQSASTSEGEQSNQNRSEASSDDKPSPLGARTVFESLLNFPKPVICAANGPALGGGTGLLFACDVVIMAESSYIQFPEVKRGIVPALISAVIAPQLGLNATRRMMMLGNRVPATELHRLGAISCVVEAVAEGSEAILAKAMEFVEELSSSAPLAVQMTKKLVNAVSLDCGSAEERLDRASDVFREMIASPEVEYGVGKFLMREKPDWSGFHAERRAKL
jgi:methylglutaconyl-CoA hydratase